MNDISNREEIRQFVDIFYGKVLKDELLSPFFKNLNFEKHLPKMVDFWSFVLLDETGYTTNVTEKHLNMPLEKQHFDQWILLFNGTIDELFTGEKAELAKQRANLIGWTILSKIEKQSS